MSSFTPFAGTDRKLYIVIENVTLWAKPNFNGFESSGRNCFGVLEYWSIGVLEKAKALELT